MVAPHYDEAKVLVDYVCWNYGSLMTEFEQKVEMAIHVLAKAAQMPASSPERAKLENYFDVSNDPKLAEALGVGSSSFHESVANRILHDHRDEVFINRCAKCNRIVRSPKARQCLWCGYSWHHAA
jgi:hypothetical protein